MNWTDVAAQPRTAPEIAASLRQICETLEGFGLRPARGFTHPWEDSQVEAIQIHYMTTEIGQVSAIWVPPASFQPQERLSVRIDHYRWEGVLSVGRTVNADRLALLVSWIRRVFGAEPCNCPLRRCRHFPEPCTT